MCKKRLMCAAIVMLDVAATLTCSRSKTVVARDDKMTSRPLLRPAAYRQLTDLRYHIPVPYRGYRTSSTVYMVHKMAAMAVAEEAAASRSHRLAPMDRERRDAVLSGEGVRGLTTLQRGHVAVGEW